MSELEEILQALRSKRWALRGNQIRDERGTGKHLGSYTSERSNGRLMAAAPELLDMLLILLDRLLLSLPRVENDCFPKLDDLERAGKVLNARLEKLFNDPVDKTLYGDDR